MRLCVMYLGHENYGSYEWFNLPVDTDDFNARFHQRWLIMDYETPFMIEDGDTIEHINDQAQLYKEFAQADVLPYVEEIAATFGVSIKEVMEQIDRIFVTEFDSYESLGKNYFEPKHQKRVPGFLFKGASDDGDRGRYLCQNFSYYRAQDGRILNLGALGYGKRKIG